VKETKKGKNEMKESKNGKKEDTPWYLKHGTIPVPKLYVIWMSQGDEDVDCSRIWASHGGEYEDGCFRGETLVNFYQTTRCYIPENSHLHVDCSLLGCDAVQCCRWSPTFRLLIQVGGGDYGPSNQDL
jgi:hypothetical protein